MFVPAMTFEEIRKEYEREKTILSKKAVMEGKHIEKNMRRYNISSIERFIDYRSPNKNRWMVLIAGNKKDKDWIKAGFWAHYPTERSYAVVSFDIVTNSISHYTGHFFTRYFERAQTVSQDNPAEIIKRFVKTNSSLANDNIKEVSPGVWQAFTQFSEGVGLGYFHQFLNLHEFRTFIANDMLNKGQLERSKWIEEKFNLPVMRNMKDNDVAA